MATIPDQTKTTIKGGAVKVQILAAGRNTLRRVEALLAEIMTNAKSNKPLASIAGDAAANIVALEEACAGNVICAEDARVKAENANEA